MLNVIAVSLVDHDPAWAGLAAAHGAQLQVLGDLLVRVHHIGSTAIPGLIAKPIIDLMPVVASIEALDRERWRIEALGYEYHGEYGVPGRRFFSLPGAGTRLVHVHFFETGSDQIRHNLAFRDYIRAHPDVAAAYAREKRRARDLHPDDSHGYAAEKAAWVRATAADARAWFARQPASHDLQTVAD